MGYRMENLMKVSGKITTVKNETVEIDPKEVVIRIKYDWMHSIGIPVYCYVNKNGQWEEWEDTGGHGSGLYTAYREATEDELRLWAMFKQLEAFMVRKAP
jgi:hypothetical protein